ncbi:MAG: tannase/feruloyl esterase family alpha/beta hydrolase, partial [Alphaproteobacteria bacterium]|nr:tannase/feruloyl esterase family alpha/beta hydrolase [Alphaproteobacteria bacterium]
MVMSQNFPDYFDGIVAGDPVYDLEAISLSEDWGVEQIYDITPQPVQRLANGSPILYPAFPASDQQLFTKAILQACNGLDGTVDGVIDNYRPQFAPPCVRRPAANPTSERFPRLGPLCLSFIPPAFRPCADQR